MTDRAKTQTRAKAKTRAKAPTPKAAAADPAADPALAATILQKAEGYRADIARFLREIIAIPSTSGKEGPVVERIMAEMRKVGFDQVYRDRVGNAVGRVGEGRTVIMYDGHTDTVGVSDRSAWAYDPFEGKAEDGRIYGLGAVDEKGALASMVYAGRIIKELGLDKGYTLYIVGTVQEEDCDGFAAGQFVKDLGRKPDLAVLGEPTNLDIYRGHRGRCEFEVVVKGKACHGSAPQRGINAIYQMGKVIEGLQKLAPKLKDDPFLGQGTIAVTKIESKSGSLNVVPDECSIIIDRRMTFGETAASSAKELKPLLAAAGKAKISLLMYDTKSHTGFVTRMPKDYPTWVTPEDHPSVQAGLETARRLFGKKPKVSKWDFSTDGVALAGVHGIPTIGYGPGDEALAHTVREVVTEDQLVKAAAFYALFPTTAVAKGGK